METKMNRNQTATVRLCTRLATELRSCYGATVNFFEMILLTLIMQFITKPGLVIQNLFLTEDK